MNNKYYISLRGRTVIINLNQSNKNHNKLRTSGIFHILENDGFTMKFIKMGRVKKMNNFQLFSNKNLQFKAQKNDGFGL